MSLSHTLLPAMAEPGAWQTARIVEPGPWTLAIAYDVDGPVRASSPSGPVTL